MSSCDGGSARCEEDDASHICVGEGGGGGDVPSLTCGEAGDEPEASGGAASTEASGSKQR